MTKKRAQLVCQHLECISRRVLEQWQEVIRGYVHGRHGVYALYRRGKLYYVGLATDLRRRMKDHLKDRHGRSWDQFSVYLTIGDQHLRELETLIVRTFKPSGNHQKGKFAKSEDLRRQFRQDIKRRQQVELEGLFAEAQPRRRRPETQARADGRERVLAGYMSRPMILRAKYKGAQMTARVQRDGSIRFAGKVYTSPSLAAAAACKRRTCNGWTFWQYERAPGDWVSLDTLRR